MATHKLVDLNQSLRALAQFNEKPVYRFFRNEQAIHERIDTTRRTILATLAERYSRLPNKVYHSALTAEANNYLETCSKYQLPITETDAIAQKLSSE